MITSCPVTPTAVTNAHTIFDPDLAGVRGRRVRRPPDALTTEYMQIPRAILNHFQPFTLAADIIFVNGVPFLVSVARGLNLLMTKHTPSRAANNLAAGIKRVMAVYSCGDFCMGTILMDNEFEKLGDLVPDIAVNTTAAKEHMPEVKRCVWLIKEQGWGILNTLPFKRMPQVMLIELIYHVVLWLNVFPMKTGVSKDILHCKIVFCKKLNFAKHCQAVFNSYCEVHNEPTPTNTILTQATPAIVFGLMGNLQGTYKFYNLLDGKKIKRRMFTLYQIPNLVIKKVEIFGAGKQDGFDFADCNGALFEWNNKVDALEGEGLVKEYVVLYPSITAEFPEVALTCHITPIKEGFKPHGCAKDATTCNANFLTAHHRRSGCMLNTPDKIDDINNDNNNIIHVGDIHPNQHPAQNLIVMPDSSDNDHDNNDDVEIDYDDSSNDGQ